MGDFNAKVGREKVDKNVGEYGLGGKMTDCQSENFVITNTMFQLPNRRLYTYRSSADNKD